MEFYSHPDKLLSNHLQEVSNINRDKIDDEYLGVYKIIAYCHDFGKFTTYFQKHLFGGKKSKYSSHGFVSALFGSYCAMKEYGEESIISLITFNIILHHHGNLSNPSEDLPRSFREIPRSDYHMQEKLEIAKRQIGDITGNKDIIGKIYGELGLQDYFNQFIEFNIEEIVKKLKKIDFIVGQKQNEKNYFIHQILYSALISADKISASGLIMPKEKYVNYADLNKEKEKRLESKESEKKINTIRTEIFNKVQDKLKSDYNKSRIFTITAPTGTGKTYAGFFAALRLKELLDEDTRIIYSLPYTSIIEQNYDVILDLFKGINDFDKEKSRYLIKHHNLANITYDSEEYVDIDRLKAELLIENWSSGIVITTFVQLMETLIGSRNRMLKKLTNIKGSIILLDEIQAIDISLLPTIEYALQRASEIYDLRIIMMTATKPLILNEAIELLEDNQEYFKLFNRTRINPRIENIGVSQFIDEFVKSIEDKSYLIVCNTINQSLKIYNGIRDLDRKVFYLSTNLLPIHRKERIKEINEALQNKENIILVSTQVVEAGVDFDFDVVIRDLGPIDSIIQCSGRCNRNGSNDIGEVYIYSMYDDDNELSASLYSKQVYGNSTIFAVKEILQDKAVINEKEYFDIINQYFRAVQNYKSQDIANNFINSVIAMNFSSDEDSDKTPLNRFSLIKNNSGYIDVYIIYDDLSQKVFDRYCEMIEEKDFYKSREIYLEIKNTLREYTLSIPEKYHGIFEKKYGLYYLPIDGAKDYYNIFTGFNRADKTFEMI